MTARAFITGLAGLDTDAGGAGFPARGERPGGSSCLQAQHRDAGAGAPAGRGAFARPSGRNAPVLVDQEGGRVQRLGPPHWPAYPPGAAYGRLYDRDPAAGACKRRGSGRALIAADLLPLGIDVDCLPIADVPAPAPTR